MRHRRKVYISGPITLSAIPGNAGRIANVQVAADAMRQLTAAGFAPLTPHTSLYLELLHGVTLDHATWMAIDLPWVISADAVLRLPGKSVGADAEVDAAKSYGVPVFESVDELVSYFARKA